MTNYPHDENNNFYPDRPGPSKSYDQFDYLSAEVPVVCYNRDTSSAFQPESDSHVTLLNVPGVAAQSESLHVEPTIPDSNRRPPR